ncbi:MAG: exonuclease domain-containing protein [Flavobacteriales bacterium]
MDTANAREALSSLNFTAIDFETANEKRHSLCAIGVVQVRNGVITNTWKQLVRPAELRFSNINRSVHRIPDADLTSAPPFAEVWETFLPMIENRIVVAHNADFDLNVLKQTLEYHGFDDPVQRSLCTMKLSRLAFPELEHHGLSDLCNHLQWEFVHHDCAEDARVAAQLAMHAIPLLGLERLNFDGPDLTGHVYSAVSPSSRSRAYSATFASKKIETSLLQPNLEQADPRNPFYKKRIVFTGDLLAFDRNTAAERVRTCGADVNTSISPKTDIVVMGTNAGPSKKQKIDLLLSRGVNIRVLDEQEFMRLLEGGADEQTAVLLDTKSAASGMDVPAIATLATQLAVRFSESEDIPPRLRGKAGRPSKTVEDRFRLIVVNWAACINTMFAHLPAEQAWRLLRMRPELPEGLSELTTCEDFLTLNTYFAQRRDSDQCTDIETGQLSQLLGEVQRVIEQHISSQ